MYYFFKRQRKYYGYFCFRMAEKKRMARWYFGGLASAGAACITHPLDLLKVRGGGTCILHHPPTRSAQGERRR
jgi:hypothetical protein